MILCVAMMCRYGLGRPELADRIERAVETVLDDGFRTPDLARGHSSEHRVGTQEMGKRVREVLG
jgi:3-isopropylmalate dehydrogenase